MTVSDVLSDDEIQERLGALEGWTIEEGRLHKEFTFSDFNAAFGFMTRVALVAEKGRDGEVYNVGGGTELTNRELTGLLLEAVGADESMIEHVPDRKGHDRRYCVDWTKIADELGYRPAVPFARGLAETVRWYAEHRDWWEPLKNR